MAKDFTFKQFHIGAFQCGMPVSTDAVLLGAWANIESANAILDVGCGTGLLSIMSAQRNAVAKIKAIEIEINAVNAAKQNSINSPWRDRISVEQIAVQDFAKNAQFFDFIICNPPYFNSGETSQNNQRAQARHTTTLSHSDLLQSCSLLLTSKGRANFVLPKVEGDKFVSLAEGSDLQLSRITYVKTTAKKEVSRVLIELTKQGQAMTCEPSQILINDKTGYSDEFIALTNLFYLNM